jgi:hypothetical protein
MNHIVYNLDTVDIDFCSQSQKTIECGITAVEATSNV